LKIAAALSDAGALQEELKDFKRKVSDAGLPTDNARTGRACRSARRRPGNCQNAGLGFALRCQGRGRASLQDLIFECRAFGIVRPRRSDLQHPQMIGVARMVFGVDVNPNGRRPR